jgi:glutathione synthase
VPGLGLCQTRMKLGITVNLLGSPEEGQTTYRLGVTAAKRGHDVRLMSAGGFSLDTDRRVRALAQRVVPLPGSRSGDELASSRHEDSKKTWIALDELDVLLLRSNPAVQTPWAQHSAINFGRIAQESGCIVLNDPSGLVRALNKLYLHSFPESVQPLTLVTRSRERLREFVQAQGSAVLKPLVGYGGRGVFLVSPAELKNLDSIIQSIARDGYVIAQEYLPAAADGDTRLFLMDGVPLQVDGRYAAFRRVRAGGDMRSNIHAGGRLRRAAVEPRMLEIAEAVRPRLVQDGMFLVGLDIVDDKLLEINVFSPGGLGNAGRLENVDFTQSVIEALESKVCS